MNFISELNNEEWISLINFCTQQHSKKVEKEAPKPVTWVNVYSESDRKDLKGNNYALLYTGNGALSLSSYRVTDFCMSTEDVGLFGHYPPIVLDEELRIFLTSRFGEDYLKALGTYHEQQVSEEMTMLAQYVSLAQNKNK